MFGKKLKISEPIGQTMNVPQAPAAVQQETQDQREERLFMGLYEANNADLNQIYQNLREELYNIKSLVLRNNTQISLLRDTLTYDNSKKSKK